MSMKSIVAGAKPLRSSTSRIEAAIFENTFISAFVYESGAGASFAAGAEAGGGASVLVGTPGETERSTTVGRADSESEEDDSAPGTEVVAAGILDALLLVVGVDAFSAAIFPSFHCLILRRIRSLRVMVVIAEAASTAASRLAAASQISDRLVSTCLAPVFNCLFEG